MSGKWASSRRRDQLPKDWKKIRERILARDGYRCTETLSDNSRCTEPATDVDHIERGNDHSEANLRSLCGHHHRKKSAAEGNAARPKAPPLRRPSEPHPGLR